MERWVDILISGLETLSILFTYDAFFHRRYIGKKYWAIAAFLFAVQYVFVQAFNSPITFLKIVVISVSLLMINLVLYYGKLIFRILVTVLAYALLYLIEFLGQFLTLSLLQIEYEEYTKQQVLFGVCGVGIVSVCVGFSYMLKRYHKPITSGPSNSWLWGALAVLFPVASFAVQIPLFYFVYVQQLDPMWAAANCVIMIAANAFVLWVIGLLEKNIQMHKRALALSEQIQVQSENIEALSSAYSNQRKMTHDFRQHMQTVSGLLQQRAVEEAQKYISEIQERQTERGLLVNTHNAAMDAILNQKAYAAKQMCIDIHFEVNDLSHIKMRSIDYTVVIANLLDNAIEACQKLDVKDRWITVKVIYDEPFGEDPAKLFLSVVNASPPVDMVDDADIPTTKENASLHGFGIPNVKRILSMYDAVYVIRYENRAFQFSIDWPDKIVRDDHKYYENVVKEAISVDWRH